VVSCGASNKALGKPKELGSQRSECDSWPPLAWLTEYITPSVKRCVVLAAMLLKWEVVEATKRLFFSVRLIA
jgi:hypothetical protein